MVDGRFSNAADLGKVKLATFHLHAYRMQKTMVQRAGNESTTTTQSAFLMAHVGRIWGSAQVCSISWGKRAQTTSVSSRYKSRCGGRRMANLRQHVQLDITTEWTA